MRILQSICRLYQAIRYYGMYVIADPNDNSVTVSRQLFRHMKSNAPPRRAESQTGAEQVFMFHVPAERYYGFAVNPDLPENTATSTLQYNDKHRTIGFEALCPTVGKIFYDYRLPASTPLKLSVIPCRTPYNFPFYKIIPPSR